MDDLSTWKTKAEAAAILGTSEKAIERYANKGTIRRAERLIPGRRPLPVYHPEDIDKLKGQTIEATPVEESPKKLPRDVRKAVAATAGQSMELLPPNVKTAIVSARIEAELVPVYRRLYLSLDEAARYSGLGIGYLRKLVEEGTLEVKRGAGPNRTDVVKRTDLERL